MKISSTYSFAYIGSSIYLRTGFPVINRKWNTVSNKGQFGTCNKMNPISKRYTIQLMFCIGCTKNTKFTTTTITPRVYIYVHVHVYESINAPFWEKKVNRTLKICYKWIEFQNVHLQTCIPSLSWRSRLQCPEMTHCRQRAGWRALFCRI